MSEYTAYFRAQLEGKDAVLNGLRQIDNERRRLDGSSAKVRVDISGIDKARYALSELGQMMQSLGSSLDSFGSLVGDKIGGAFSNMASMFDTDFLHYAKLWTSKAVTQLFFDNTQASAQRFDIMSTYNDYLDIMGISADQAAESLEKINAAIQGLPVGLSDVAFQTRRYAMYLDNDLERSTNLAIGMNRALIAGGANEQMRHTATYEIERLLAVGKLNTARQWNALLQGLGVSVKFLQENMGVTDMTIQDFAEALSKGEISTNDFLAGIESLADSENLNRALEIYKGTIESAMSNLQFALIRGKANVIDAFNETLKEVTGTGIAGTINKVRDNLNELFFGIQDYIKDRPEMLAKAIDTIMGIVDRAKGFDWAGTADKVFTNLGRMLEIMVGMWDKLPEGAVSDFVSFALTWAGPLGKAFKAIQSGLPFMFALFERMKDFDFESLATKVFDAVGNLIGKMVDILNMIPDSTMEKLITFGLVWATPLGKAFSGIGKMLTLLASSRLLSALGKLGTAGGAANAARVGSTLKSFLAGFAGITMLNVSIAEVGLVILEFAKIAESIGKMDFGNFTSNLPLILEVVGGVGLVIGGLVSSMAALNALTEGASSLAIFAGEGVVAGYEALIAGMGIIIIEYADIAEKISKLNIDDAKFTSNAGKLAEILGGSDILLTALGAFSVATGGFTFIGGSVVSEILRALRAVVDMTEPIGKISNWEFGFADAAQFKDKLQTIVNAVKDIKQIFDNAWVQKGDKGEINRIDFTKFKEDADAIAGAMTAVSGLITAMNDANQYMADANISATWNADFKYRMKYLSQTISDVYDFLDTAITRDVTQNGEKVGEEWISESEVDWMAKVAGNFAKAMASVADIANQFIAIENSIDTLGISFSAGRAGYKSRIGKLLEIVGTVFNDLQNAMTLKGLTDEDGNPLPDQLWGEYDSSAFAETVGNISKMIASVSQMATSLSTIKTTLDDMGLSYANGPTTAGTIASEIGQVIGGIKQVFDTLDTTFDTDVNGILAKAESAYEAMKKIGELIVKIQSMSGMTSSMTGGEEGFTFGTELGTIFSELSAAFDQLGGDSGTVGDLAGAFDNLAGSLGSVSDQGDPAAEAVNAVKQAVDDMAGAMSGKSGTVNSFASNLNYLGAMARAAASGVNSLKSAIDGLYDKTVNVRVNYQSNGGIVKAGNVIRNGGANRMNWVPMAKANGGLIYRAGGGFAPLGTDTVPAMLTPGEYVHRRAAVKLFGKEFMERINNLDLTGALNSLVMRAGSGMIPSSLATINNTYNRDNHATVNQKIYTNNPNYGFRRANRYVKAL